MVLYGIVRPVYIHIVDIYHSCPQVMVMMFLNVGYAELLGFLPVTFLKLVIVIPT